MMGSLYLVLSMGVPSGDQSAGLVVWIEGLPGAGKSSVAHALKDLLALEHRHVEVLDGAEVRKLFSTDLGYSRKDRETHAHRVSLVARMLAQQGIVVIVAMVTPYETARRAARAAVGKGFVEVWLNCPVEICRTRDPNGLYTRSDGGLVRHLTGVDDPFEDPLDPEIEIDTVRNTPPEAARLVLERLRARGLLKPPMMATACAA